MIAPSSVSARLIAPSSASASHTVCPSAMNASLKLVQFHPTWGATHFELVGPQTNACEFVSVCMQSGIGLRAMWCNYMTGRRGHIQKTPIPVFHYTHHSFPHYPLRARSEILRDPEQCIRTTAKNANYCRRWVSPRM